MTTKLLEGPLPPVVFHFSVTDHTLFAGTNNKPTPMTHMTIAAITSCFISHIFYIKDSARTVQVECNRARSNIWGIASSRNLFAKVWNNSHSSIFLGYSASICDEWPFPRSSLLTLGRIQVWLDSALAKTQLWPSVEPAHARQNSSMTWFCSR